MYVLLVSPLTNPTHFQFFLLSFVKLRVEEEVSTGKKTELGSGDLEQEDDDGALFSDPVKVEEEEEVEVEEEGEGEGEGEGEKGMEEAEKEAETENDGDAQKKRMNFVLDRVDFRNVNLPVEEEDEELTKEHLVDEVAALYGIIEFMRNGDEGMLGKVAKEAWSGTGTGTGTGTEATVEKAVAVAVEEVVATEKTANETENEIETEAEATEFQEEKKEEQKTERKSSWKGLSGQQQATGEPLQWKDFLLKLNYKLPAGRKTETAQDRLMRRMQASTERIDMMVTRKVDGKKECMYTGKKFKDEFEPEAPEAWDHEQQE